MSEERVPNCEPSAVVIFHDHTDLPHTEDTRVASEPLDGKQWVRIEGKGNTRVYLSERVARRVAAVVARWE